MKVSKFDKKLRGFDKTKFENQDKFLFTSFLVSSIFTIFLISLSFLRIYSITFGTTIVTLCSLILLNTLRNGRSNNHQSMLTSGSFWFLIAFAILFIITPIFLISDPENLPIVFAERDWKKNFWKAQLFAAIAIQSVTSGHLLRASREVALSDSQAKVLITSQKKYQYSALPSLLFSVIALIAFLSYLIGTGDPITALMGTRRQKGIFEIKSGGYAADSYLIVVGILTFWLVHFRIKRNVLRTRLIIFALVLLMIPSAVQGNRSYFIYFAVVVLIVYLSTGLKLKRTHLVAALLIFPLLINLPRDFRENQSLRSSVNIQKYYSLESVRTLFSVGDTSMAPTFSILLGEMGNNLDFVYGASYLKALAKPIPRSLFTEKPIEFDNTLNEKIFPSYSRFVKFSFSGLSEPFVNFGLTGIVFFFGFIGYISRYFQRNSIFVNENAILVNAWVAGFMFIVARGNLTTDIHRLLFPLIATLFVIKTSTRIKKVK